MHLNKSHCLSLQKNSLQLLFRDTIPVYSENKKNVANSVGNMQSSIVLKRVVHTMNISKKLIYCIETSKDTQK